MVKPKFLIFSSPYDPLIGGVVVMHKLAHLISAAGYEARMFPLFNNREISPLNWQAGLRATLNELEVVESIFSGKAKYRLNPAFSTQLFSGSIGRIAAADDLVVVYPEVTFGNPLRAKHVARWLLHDPGFHTGRAHFAKGEVQFRYSENFRAIESPHVSVAPFYLNVIDIPWHLFNRDAAQSNSRVGSAYLMKKGKGRPLVHDLESSVCIDGKNILEIAEIFKRIKIFYSYDSITFFSALATMSGAVSVVIPDSPECPDPQAGDLGPRNGVAYGMDDIPRALATVDAMKGDLSRLEADSVTNVGRFIDFWVDRINNNIA